MKHAKILCVAACLTFGISLSGHASGKSKTAANQPTLASVIDGEISNLENQFVAAAEAMPEDKFDYSPESLNLPGSDFKGVRTFAAQVKHVAADNFAIWAPLTGKPEPARLNAPNGPDELKSRAEVLKFLKDSFAFGHNAVAGLTSENALDLVEFRKTRLTRINLAIFPLTHMNDHYGQMVEYLRMNGIVPPAARPKVKP